jgi:hypothetical protein
MWQRSTRFVLMCVLVALIQGAAFGAWNPLGDPALIGWWACDEGAGAVVGDSSANGNDGAFKDGDGAWMPGVYGSAITLIGPTVVEVPATNLTLTEATMAGWFMPYGTQPDWASIIMHRVPGNASGFNLLGSGQLAYHWNDASSTWSFRPDAYYSATEWTFCTVTIAPDKATFYINGEAKAENVVAHGPSTWSGPIWLGGDGSASWVARRMNGSLDDVSFFSRALAAEEVAALMDGLAGAAVAEWENAAAAGAPVFIATNVADGVYDIGNPGAEITYEFVVKSNPDETQASMCLIGRRNFGDTQAGIKYEQWSNTGTYGATLFGVVDLDFGVPTNPGVPTVLTFISSEAAQKTDLYVDGVFKGSVPNAITLAGPVGIGYGAQAEDGSSFFDDFDGEILGVAIYGRALPIGEMRLHCDAYYLKGAYDVTTPGDPVIGLPNGLPCGGNATANYWPCGEVPEMVIDNNVSTKYLNFGGNFNEGETASGFQVTPSIGATIVTEITFTTANDAVERDPIAFELYGSNDGIEGPYTLITSGYIMDFAGADAWPRFTKNATPITFENTTPYTSYQVLFTFLRNSASANSMQIAEVELIGVPYVEFPKATVYFEDFEAYEVGASLHGQGGWRGWQGDAGAGAPASDAFAFSGTQSVEIIGSADLVQVFEANGGVVEFSAMQYIPSGTTGTTYFILMNQYNDAGNGLDWSVQTNFNLDTGVVNFDGGTTAQIVYDQWVEVKCVIDLDNNSVDLYYNGELIVTNVWDDTAHTTFQAVDLYGNGASSVYYDNVTLKQ